MSSLDIEEFIQSLPKEQRDRLDQLLLSPVGKAPAEFVSIVQQGPLSAQAMWRQLSVQKNMNKLLFPLSSKSIAFVQQSAERSNGEQSPQYPFLLCALMSLIVRILAIIATQSYLCVTGGRDQETNLEIVKILRRPTDNQWLRLATMLFGVTQKSAKEAEGQEELHQLVDDIISMLKQPALVSAEEVDAYHIFNLSGSGKRQQIRTVGDLLKFVLRFRNELIHAHPLTDEHISGAGIAMMRVLQALLPLTTYQLRTRIGEQGWQMSGRYPKMVDDGVKRMEDRALVIYKGEAAILTLSPLMCLAQDIENIDEEQDIFFINAGSLQKLQYIGFVCSEHFDGHNLGTYEQFKTYMAQLPVPAVPLTNPRVNFDDYVADKSRHFVGRQELLAEINEAIAERGGQYLIIKALAGMGKSAVMAQLYNQHNEPFRSPQSKDPKPTGDVWVFHFCMHTGGRDTALVAYRSLIAQIQQAMGTYNRKRKLPTDAKELKELFQTEVNACAEQLAQRGGQRLVVVIDALDESLFVEEESIPSSIPTFIQDHVIILVSYRVNNKVENRRIDQFIDKLPQENTQVLSTANPLVGLCAEDVTTFLTLANGAAISEEVYTAVWKAASQDSAGFADPFYLRFVIDGVEKKRYSLQRKETIPDSLHTAFEQMWLDLPPDRDFLAHRLLLTLGVMRDFGDDELFAELFTRESPEAPFTADDIAAQRIKTGKLLIYDGDRYGLFHDRFRHFLVGEQKDPIEEALGLTD